MTTQDTSDKAEHDIERSATEQACPVSHKPEKVTTALDWIGPEDPENPENWSTGKKAFHIAYVGLQCFVV